MANIRKTNPGKPWKTSNSSGKTWEDLWQTSGRPQADRGITDQAFRRFARSSLGLPTLLYQIGGRRWLEDFDMRWEDLGRHAVG